MDQIYKAAIRFEQKLDSYIDDWGHAVAKSLKSEIRRLQDEIEMQKNPRSLEDRVKGIKHLIEGLRDDLVMDYRHQDDLKDDTDNLIQALRRA